MEVVYESTQDANFMSSTYKLNQNTQVFLHTTFLRVLGVVSGVTVGWDGKSDLLITGEVSQITVARNYLDQIASACETGLWNLVCVPVILLKHFQRIAPWVEQAVKSNEVLDKKLANEDDEDSDSFVLVQSPVGGPPPVPKEVLKKRHPHGETWRALKLEINGHRSGRVVTGRGRGNTSLRGVGRGGRGVASTRSTGQRGRGVVPSRGRGVVPSRGRGVAPSRGRGVASSRGAAPSRGRVVASSRGRGAAPSRGRGLALSRGRGVASSRGRGLALPRGNVRKKKNDAKYS